MKQVPERELWKDCEDATPRDVSLARIGRRPVELTGYLIRQDKKIVDVKVSDLSYDGCAVRTLFPLVPGEQVKLSLLGRGAVQATVRWYHGRQAGLHFMADQGSKPHRPRKAERISLKADLSLRRSGQGSYRVTMFDLTRFGCKCEFIERPAVHERLWVKFHGLDSLEAIACWVEESCLGLKFTNPLHPAVFEMLLARLGQPAAPSQ